MMNRIVSLLVLMPILLFGGSMTHAAEKVPLELHLIASKDTLQITLTNISYDTIEVLPWFNAGPEDSLGHIAFDIRDWKGRRQEFAPAVEYGQPKKSDWIPLPPGRFVGVNEPINDPIGGISSDYHLHKAGYTVRAVYHAQYYSEDGKAHEVRIVSNMVTIISKTDVMADFCAGHFPDGSPVPKIGIALYCHKK